MILWFILYGLVRDWSIMGVMQWALALRDANRSNAFGSSNSFFAWTVYLRAFSAQCFLDLGTLSDNLQLYFSWEKKILCLYPISLLELSFSGNIYFLLLFKSLFIDRRRDGTAWMILGSYSFTWIDWCQSFHLSLCMFFRPLGQRVSRATIFWRLWTALRLHTKHFRNGPQRGLQLILLVVTSVALETCFPLRHYTRFLCGLQLTFSLSNIK